MKKYFLLTSLLLSLACGKDDDDLISQSTDYRIFGSWSVESMEDPLLALSPCENKKQLYFNSKNFTLTTFTGDSCQFQNPDVKGTYFIKDGVLSLFKEKEKDPYLIYNIDNLSKDHLTLSPMSKDSKITYIKN